jgi:membrane protein YqaA with SNARE-associated domain
MTISVYFGLFISAFAAATLFPLQSEVFLTSLLVLGKQPAWVLVAVAGVGNTLGSMVNWLLGRHIERYRHKRWFPISVKQLDRAQQYYQRYGRWSLLLSWMPVIGDPLTLVAGVMRETLWRFSLIVLLAKTGRYLAIALITLGLL